MVKPPIFKTKWSPGELRFRFHLRTENWPMETNMTIWRVKENFTKTSCWSTLTSHPKRRQAASLQTPVGSIPADPGLKCRTTSVDQNFAKHLGCSGGNSKLLGKMRRENLDSILHHAIYKKPGHWSRKGVDLAFSLTVFSSWDDSSMRKTMHRVDTRQERVENNKIW